MDYCNEFTQNLIWIVYIDELKIEFNAFFIIENIFFLF